MEEKIPNGIPPFHGRNFEYYSNRMETYLKYLGADVCFSIASGYNALKKPKTAAVNSQNSTVILVGFYGG
jgi:hypothetical protein